MRIFNLKVDSGEKLAIEKNDKLYLLEDLGYRLKDMNELIDREIDLSNIDFSKAKALDRTYNIQSPIVYPKQDIICLGMNYSDHKDEVEKVSKEDFSKDVDTIYFSKRVNRILGYGDTIPLNENITNQLDYEVELCLIIGKDAKNVSKKEASSYIFGFSIFNDLSARDLQRKYKQRYYGKSFDYSSVMGPAILINDGSFNYNNLELTTRINGDLRQKNTTKNMILSVDGIIEDLSKAMTLKKGTIIATGTPAGVAMSSDSFGYLSKGDEIQMEIENIGELYNKIN